jgi:hypothetical protein
MTEEKQTLTSNAQYPIKTSLRCDLMGGEILETACPQAVLYLSVNGVRARRLQWRIGIRGLRRCAVTPLSSVSYARVGKLALHNVSADP